MASLKHLIASGTARILGPIYAENFIVPNGSSSQILLANGTTTPTSTFQSALPSYSSSDAGKALKINAGGTGLEWSTAGGGGGASALNDLSDVSITGTSYSSQVLKYDGTNWANVPYNIPSGTCSDSSGSAKVVSINGITALTDGLMIRVKNSATATSSSATLNLNGLGAKAIVYNQNGTWTQITSQWAANAAYTFVYDTLGDSTGRWVMVDRDYNANTNNATLQSVQSVSTWKKVLLSYDTVASATGTITSGSTHGVHYVNSIAAQCSTGSLAANAFVTNGGTADQFVKGNGTLGTYVTIYSGSSAPDNNTGNDGDIYIKTTA